MEIFVRDVPSHCTDARFKTSLEDAMQCMDIEDWTYDRFGQRDLAKIVFLKESDCWKFYRTYGQVENPFGNNIDVPGRIQLEIDGQPIKCTLNKKQLDPFAIKGLEYAREMRPEQENKLKNRQKTIASSDFHNYDCENICCGIWDYKRPNLYVQGFFQLEKSAKLVFGSRNVSFETCDSGRLDIAYFSIESIARGRSSLLFTLREAPRISQASKGELNGSIGRKRVTGLDADHEGVSGSCLVYRIGIKPQLDLKQKLPLLRQIRGLPHLSHRSVTTTKVGETYASALKGLRDALLPRGKMRLPFSVRFQVQKLAQNGYLSPKSVLLLVPAISEMFNRSGELVTTAAVRKLFRVIPYAGPDVEPEQFSTDSLVKLLNKLEAETRSDSFEVEHSGQVAMIHKAQVTPTGIYLYGPDAESNNRVLRKYSKHHDCFLRVQFSEEDGSQVRFSRTVSNKDLFQRFKWIMNSGIPIAGRTYSFLGFSHSSLRSQSCWFMAPFSHEGGLLYHRQLIKGLGDFSHIRCPARCAARIGQAFSDTREAIPLPPNIAREIPDVKRNNRVFSDGVGTISQQALDLIWAGLPSGKRPTVIQLRYQGVKGMVALDSRVQGLQLCLRESMTKFRGSDSTDLEICTAGYKPIALYLNEQMIPILDKLGVSHEWFFDLQKQEIERLSLVSSTAKHAAKFLASHAIGDKLRLPWFIEKLSHIDLAFQQDEFLTRVVEAAVLVQLRNLKYKARIPVKEGFTLLGILDETGILKEGEVFCIADIDGVAKVITSQRDEKIIVTRSPALHPGDIQTAVAVEVPNESPLMKLRNCIAFSQKGPRDLPSMLSGGDLDGDLYHIIFDRKARLNRPPFEPADYPRVSPRELHREVEKSDMTDFFVEFMEVDQLGRICVMHKIIADQSEEGVSDARCIDLAEMASTAVDFSKTGQPVDMDKFRMIKYSPMRPHFMAPGPNVEIMRDKPISFDPDSTGTDDDEAPDYKYYKSTRILGKLFDAVDEYEVFRRLKTNRKDSVVGARKQDWEMSTSLLKHLLKDIRQQFQKIDWRTEISQARWIRDQYENSVFDLMYEYGPSPHRPLSEVEVFIGSIIGRNGAPTNRQREMAMSMKDRFETIMAATVKLITAQNQPIEGENEERGGAYDDEHNQELMLNKSISTGMACLWVAINMGARQYADGKILREGLKSFGYIAAALTLKSIDSLEKFLATVDS